MKRPCYRQSEHARTVFCSSLILPTFSFLLFFPSFCIKIYNCKKLRRQLPIVIFCNDVSSVDIDNAEVSQVLKNRYPFCYQNAIGRLCGHRVMTCSREFVPVVDRNGGVFREWQIYANNLYFLQKFYQNFVILITLILL